MTVTAPEPEYLSVKLLAAKFRVSERKVYRGVSSGWPHAVVGHSIRFSPAHVAVIEALVDVAGVPAEPVRGYTEADIARALKKSLSRTT